MRSLLVAIALLGTINALQAREAEPQRALLRSSAEPARQLVVNSGESARSSAQKSRQEARNGRDFSAERLIPDICRGC
jgi:hypothetical protein